MASHHLALVYVVSSLLLVACSVGTTKVPGSASRVKAEEWKKIAQRGNVESAKPTTFSIPELAISNPKTSYKSSWMTGPEGRYQVNYWKFPETSTGKIHNVRIIASPTPAPVLDDAPSCFVPWKNASMLEVQREWEQVEVPGIHRSLRYYLQDFAFGDTNTTWNSEIFPITTPDGRQGSYQVTVECDEAYYAKAQFAKIRLR